MLPKAMTTITTTTKHYRTKCGRLHGPKYIIFFYHKPYIDPTH